MNRPQEELPLFVVAPESVNVAYLVEFLRSAGGWVVARHILIRWGLEDTDQNRRFIRALAEAAGADVISGQKGYLHIAHATVEEAHHAASWLESQASKMAAKACAIRRRAHALIG